MPGLGTVCSHTVAAVMMLSLCRTESKRQGLLLLAHHISLPFSSQPLADKVYYGKNFGDTALHLSQESTLNVDLDFKQPFLELNRILEALHEQDLGPALE